MNLSPLPRCSQSYGGLAAGKLLVRMGCNRWRVSDGRGGGLPFRVENNLQNLWGIPRLLREARVHHLGHGGQKSSGRGDPTRVLRRAAKFRSAAGARVCGAVFPGASGAPNQGRGARGDRLLGPDEVPSGSPTRKYAWKRVFFQWNTSME